MMVMRNFGLPFIAVSTAAMLTLSGCERPVPAPDEVEAPEATPAGDVIEPVVEATGKVIDIMMYTIDPDDPSEQHVFKPRLVSAQVGDTIRFIPTESSHQSSSIASMLPDASNGWEGEVNQEISYTIPAPGIYGFQCVPHYAAGMVGVVIVEGEGKLANLERAKQSGHPGLGVPEFFEIFAEAESARHARADARRVRRGRRWRSCNGDRQLGAHHAAISPRANSQCDQISDSALISRVTSPSSWTGEGVSRSRSVPTGTVG